MITKITNIIQQLRPERKAKGLKLSSCYLHIKDIPLDKFITAHCEKDLSVLVISGKPTEEEKAQAWDSLFKQYIKIIGGNQFDSKLKEYNQYNKIRDKVSRALHCLELSKYPDATETLCKVINTFGYSIPTATIDNINTVLQQFEGFLKLDITRLNRMADKLEKQEKKGANKEPTYDDYYNTILDIQEAISVKIVPTKDNVLTYALAVKKLKAHIDRLIKQNEKTKHKN